MAGITQAMTHVSCSESPDNFRLALEAVGRCDRRASSSETGSDSGTDVHDPRSLGAVKQPNDGRNEIADIDPVAHLVSIFEQTWPLAGPDPSGHLGNDRGFPIVQSQPRAIDRRESQDIYRTVIKALKAEFLHVLRCTVSFQWCRRSILLNGNDLGDGATVRAINFVTLGEQVRFLARAVRTGTAMRTCIGVVGSVDTEASGKNHTLELWPAPRMFQKSCGPATVRVDDVRGFPGRAPHSAERGKMDDRFDVFETGIRLHIAKIRKTVIHIVAQVLRRTVMDVWIQAVEGENVSSLARRPIDEMGSNKASRSCD